MQMQGGMPQQQQQQQWNPQMQQMGMMQSGGISGMQPRQGSLGMSVDAAFQRPHEQQQQQQMAMMQVLIHLLCVLKMLIQCITEHRYFMAKFKQCTW